MGIAYTFVAGEPVGIRDKDALSADFRIYPNPAAALTTFNFTLESVENVTLTIINAKGQMVLQNEPGTLRIGENQVDINLSGLADGIYTCRITNGKSSNVETLVIAH